MSSQSVLGGTSDEKGPPYAPSRSLAASLHLDDPDVAFSYIRPPVFAPPPSVYASSCPFVVFPPLYSPLPGQLTSHWPAESTRASRLQGFKLNRGT